MPVHSYDAAALAQRMGAALAASGQPLSIYRAVEEATREIVGHDLFTILAVHSATGEVERMHTSRPNEYPLLGRKLMGPTPWGDHVLRGGNTWFGRSADDIRWAFPDHELILSLDCGSCLNAPVRYDKASLGVVSVLGPAGRYDEGDTGLLAFLAPYLVPALLRSQSA